MSYDQDLVANKHYRARAMGGSDLMIYSANGPQYEAPRWSTIHRKPLGGASALLAEIFTISDSIEKFPALT
jgi:hypothetical protein